MQVRTVGVIGAGQMGNGIAHVFALAGYDVLLTDIGMPGMDGYGLVRTLRENLDDKGAPSTVEVMGVSDVIEALEGMRYAV